MARHVARIFSLLLSISILLSAVQSAFAQSTDRTIAVEADARVEADHANTNYGSQHRLTADGKPRMEAYMRFNVAGVSAVERAQLRLWTTSGAGVLPTVYRADNNWSEKSITWSNRPARSGNPVTIQGGVSAGKWLTLDISPLIDRAGTYTLVLTQDSADSLSFSARESSHPAQLIITPGAALRGEQAPASPTSAGSPTASVTVAPTKATSSTTTATAPPTATTKASPVSTSTPKPTASPMPSATPTPSATPVPSATSVPAAPTQAPKADPPSPSGKTYYVAKTGNNSDGRSWSNAWDDVDHIQWSRIKPGDLILIKADTYNSRLVVGASGTSSAPIWIRASGGTVRLFGGRETPLPYCEQPGYQQKGKAGESGIEVGNQSNIVIDGASWGGIKIYGWNYGIQLKDSAHDITVKYVEIYDNGTIESANGVYRPRMHGVTMEESNHDITFERAQIHDNGSDAFHSYGGTSHFTLRESWLYNARKAPDGSIFNGCTHPDGIQYSTVEQSNNVLVEQSVMGPGVYHGILAGGNTIEDVVFRDVLIYNALTSTIATRTSGARDWLIDHVTSVQSSEKTLHLEISAGSGHTIKDTLVVGGSRNVVVSGTSFQNNYQDDVTGSNIGKERVITFRDPKNGDYTPQTDVNGAGSRLTSIKSLLSRP